MSVSVTLMHLPAQDITDRHRSSACREQCAAHSRKGMYVPVLSAAPPPMAALLLALRELHHGLTLPAVGGAADVLATGAAFGVGPLPEALRLYSLNTHWSLILLGGERLLNL